MVRDTRWRVLYTTLYMAAGAIAPAIGATAAASALSERAICAASLSGGVAVSPALVPVVGVRPSLSSGGGGRRGDYVCAGRRDGDVVVERDAGRCVCAPLAS